MNPTPEEMIAFLQKLSNERRTVSIFSSASETCVHIEDRIGGKHIWRKTLEESIAAAMKESAK